MRTLLPLIIAGSISCGAHDTPDAQAATSAPTAPAATTPDAPAALPDVSAQLSGGGCDDGPGVYGAASYFVGDFALNGDAARGTERWVIFANEKWKQKGGGDCQITWNMTGFKRPVGACTGCDFGLDLSAEPDVAGSNCVEDLVKREAKSFKVGYDIKLLSNGTSQVYFSKSGKLLGEGYQSGGRFNYVTDHQCKWW